MIYLIYVLLFDQNFWKKKNWPNEKSKVEEKSVNKLERKIYRSANEYITSLLKKKIHHFVPFSTVDYISEDEALLLFVPFRCMSAKMATMT